MLPYADVLGNSQGFAMALFAARNNSKAKMGTAPGRMWTFILRRTLRTVLITAKADLFQRPISTTADVPAAVGQESSGAVVTTQTGESAEKAKALPMEPDWMSSFKDNASIIRAVDESMAKFEGSTREFSASSATADSVSEGPLFRPRKRKKVSGGEVDAEQETRLHVVKHIRSLWLEKMNNGRTAARIYLYKSLFFILDKIAQFKDVDRACQSGYSIKLHDQKSEIEDVEAERPHLEQTIWNISDAVVDKGPDTDSQNLHLLEELKKQFASLHATVTYKKQIEITVNEADPSYTATRETQYISVNQHVSFHDVALEMLMEIHSCDSGASVLATSELSLKAIHILAIALRGLVVNVLNQWRRPPLSLSALELAAFGSDVDLDDEKKVAVMMEKRLKSGAVSDTYTACYKEKFYISEADAETLRRSIGAVGQRTAETALLSDAAGLSSEMGVDEREDWIHRK